MSTIMIRSRNNTQAGITIRPKTYLSTRVATARELHADFLSSFQSHPKLLLAFTSDFTGLQIEEKSLSPFIRHEKTATASAQGSDKDILNVTLEGGIEGNRINPRSPKL